MFGKGSALILYSMICHFQPKRIIEAGSGFTSALMLDTNNRYMNNQIKFTFIEPFPERLYSLLKEDDNKITEIQKKPIQEIPIDCFSQLNANDILSLILFL